jgi:hypothetical protein
VQLCSANLNAKQTFSSQAAWIVLQLKQTRVLNKLFHRKIHQIRGVAQLGENIVADYARVEIGQSAYFTGTVLLFYTCGGKWCKFCLLCFDRF